MNLGHPDVAARLMHEGLALLGWCQPADGGTDDLPAEHQAPAARLLRSCLLSRPSWVTRDTAYGCWTAPSGFPRPLTMTGESC